MANQTYAWDTLPSDRTPSEGRERIAGRYEPISLIATGGHGSVWRARDQLLDEVVALKLIDSSTPRQLDAARREITAMLWARLPGIVGLRDEGLDGATWYIVMDLVEGSPFPGVPTPCTWDRLAPRVLPLLDALARLHFSGLTHRDLKPQNVLVSPTGHPTVVDLGISAGKAVRGPRGRRFVGTPLYASPEQCRGEPAGPASDLYSLGLMIVEALSGWVPLAGPNARAILKRRSTDSAPPVSPHLPHVPSEVCSALDQMLQQNPHDRPVSALEVLRLLGGEIPSVFQSRSDLSAWSSWQELRQLFTGPDRFHHERTDAALELWRRTGGQREWVESELSAWLSAGLGTWDGERIRVGRRALRRLKGGERVNHTAMPGSNDPDEQTLLDWIRIAFPSAIPAHIASACGMAPIRLTEALQRLTAQRRVWTHGGRLFAGSSSDTVPHWTAQAQRAAQRALARSLRPSDPWRLRRLAAGGAAETDLLDEVLESANRLTDQGLHAEAYNLLRHSGALTTGLDAERQPELLTLLTATALAANTQHACNEALYLVERTQPNCLELARLAQLLRAQRAAHSGESTRALELMNACGAFETPPLDWCWQRLRLEVARLQGPTYTQEALRSMRHWAKDVPRRTARVQSWRGTVHYNRGDYATAASLCLAAAEQLRAGSDRNAARINAAGALLEIGHFNQAIKIARMATRDARTRRNPRHEAVALWICRAIAYRAGWPLTPRPDLAQAASTVTAYTGGLFALNEAAIAMRCERRPLARELAEFAATHFSAAGLSGRADLARALGIAVGSPTSADLLIERAAEQRDPELDLQILGLVAMGVGSGGVPSEVVRQLVSQIPTTRHTRRLDIMSINECLEALGIARGVDTEMLCNFEPTPKC